LNKLSKIAVFSIACILYIQNVSSQSDNLQSSSRDTKQGSTKQKPTVIKPTQSNLPWLTEELPANFLTKDSNNAVLRSLGLLETSRDPKCHATATRLESLIYGTPLSNEARYRKTEYQKQFIQYLWQAAAKSVEDNVSNISLTQLQTVTPAWYKDMVTTATQNDAVWHLVFGSSRIDISQRDQEHYGSIAYSLRAILAVQQAQLLSETVLLPPLNSNAVEQMTHLTDMLTLALLQVADKLSREQDKYEISTVLLDKAWLSLFPVGLSQSDEQPIPVRKRLTAATIESSGMLRQIVAQKVDSYKAYNQINNQLFARNLQVYFAYASLPTDEKQNQDFRQTYTQAMVGFATSLYEQANLQSKQQVVITEAHVQQALDALLPHDVNTYEDVTFFPNYPKKQEVVIESYDMDAFRDSGLHWHYLDNALDKLKGKGLKEADPFAAELLTEGIAHFGVLLLRQAGKVAKVNNVAQGDNETILSAEHVVTAWQKLSAQIIAYADYIPPVVVPTQIISAAQQQALKDSYFTRVDEQYNVNFQHRSSDWLSRQLRSYLKKDQVTGNITIPPAFGGSGVAAEDIDGDGLIDLLILSGAGNKLLKNTGSKFVDITEAAGLNWLRDKDGQPGEPRQPIIIDLDNDGDQDIVITYVNDIHRVYSNNSDGTFTDVSTLADLGGTGLVGGPAVVVDVNNDGLLDIYIAYFGNYLEGVLPTLKRKNINGTANQLFLNTGGFTFEKADAVMGAADTGWGQAIAHTDINQDGWQDIIVGNDFGINGYYLNQKGKSFTDAAAILGTNKPSYTMNISLSDLNQDGYTDFYISNIVTMNKDENYVLPSKDTQSRFNPDKLANMRVVEGNDLFISGLTDKSLTYSMSDKVGRGDSSTGWAWDADFFDVDNDGDDDLYVANGMNDYYVYSTKKPYHGGKLTFPDASKASNVFYLNNEGWLKNQSAASGLDIVANSRSVTYFDLEGDGDLDVLINNYHDKAALFQNNAERLNNNWLKIKLQGAPQHGVNLDAIGAQVLVGFGTEGYVWRQVSSSQGYLSVHPKTQHVGLGREKTARVVVIWPNGQRESFGILTANNTYTLRYGVKK
jgi:hypothetical protein